MKISLPSSSLISVFAFSSFLSLVRESTSSMIATKIVPDSTNIEDQNEHDGSSFSTTLSNEDFNRVLQVSDYATAVCGGAPFKCDPRTEEAPKTSTYGVRCCNDTVFPGSKKRLGCNVYGGSKLGNPRSCRTSATFQEAVDICAASGARLCTQEELLNKCAKSTGCGLNKVLVWSSGSIALPYPSPTVAPVAGGPTPGSTPPSYCCSHNLVDCFYPSDNWCEVSEGNCIGCNGYWVEKDSNCGLPLWGLCAGNEGGCCPPSTCVDQGTYKDCQLEPASTPSPTKRPTKAPIAATNDYCCSTNIRDCAYEADPGNWCNQNQSQCTGCSGYWVEEGNNCGIPLWGTCTDNEEGCCDPAICVDQGSYKQCLVV